MALLIKGWLVFVSVAMKKQASLGRIAVKLLIAAILILSALQCRANYAELGFNRELSLDSLIKVNGYFYAQASKGINFESIGVGIGYKIKALNVVVTVNSENEKAAINLHAMYYDLGMPAFVSIGKNSESKYSYKIGVGYPLNEKVSLILHQSNSGMFFGVRRWL